MRLRTFFSIPYSTGSFSSALRVLKLTSIFVLITCITANAKTIAQSITFSASNVSLKKIFDEIKKQSEYTVFYNYDILEDAKKVTIHVKEASVEQVLDLALKDQQLTYVIEDKMIAIYKKKADKNSEVKKNAAATDKYYGTCAE